MSGQAGKDLLLKIGDGASPESFTTLAGIRAKTISLVSKTVEVTNADSPDRWRELIAGAGVKTANVNGSGVFKDAPSDARMRQVFFDQSLENWRLVIPDFGTLEGPFQIVELNYSGDFDGEARFATTLSSAGKITFSSL